MSNTEFTVGDDVLVKTYSWVDKANVWCKGVVIGFTEKRIKCVNSGTVGNTPRNYLPSSVKKI